MAKCIMVQGTSSNAGKSVMVAALCRIYSRRGYKVAPFKSQNMSLNSYTTKENGEIAIAQVLQAEAADIEPSIHMNPILLKPKGNFKSQVIIQGKAICDMNFYDYQHDFRQTALEAIKESLAILNEEYDLIFIEGAGSPAEINMREEDLANMEIAHLADADVLLVADIDKGGVFASIAGTFLLLDDYDRKRLKAVIINKFSGNLDILMPGIEKIEKIIEAPVLGVLPYDHSLHLPEEDSASLFEHKFEKNRDITIGVIRLPKIANFTDIDPFEFEDDVGLKLIDINENIKDDELDAIIIPGTRNTVEDMIAIKESGIGDGIKELAKKIPVVGLCGGYQILGKKIFDESNRESPLGTIEGLGLLEIESYFSLDEEKIVQQSEGILVVNYEIGNDGLENNENGIIRGYEIHEGTTELKGSKPLLKLIKGIGNSKNSEFDGAIEGNVFGTYLHGIFHNYNFRRSFLNYIRKQKGLTQKFGDDPYETKKDYSIDKLAQLVENNLNMDFIDDLIEK
ncbi:cobyric acid synthase [Methanobrevibacter cuticularis]|uniref:Probable cobyric acid synthase n=1 Tax=Methanobrevibacter cuticularis TaxID=47311 RepID=A0A166F7N6_9EURY|nr:cobyric acid synthase [Methanobrevibacter cuticularis]